MAYQTHRVTKSDNESPVNVSQQIQPTLELIFAMQLPIAAAKCQFQSLDKRTHLWRRESFYLPRNLYRMNI